MKKAEKVIFAENLTQELKDAKSVVLVNFAGLSVKFQQELKTRLTAVNAKMVVVKNTLLKRAGMAAKIDAQVLADSILSGQTALVLASGDPVAPIQVLGKFAKEFEVPTLKVGIVDGLFQDAPTLLKLSTLPPRSVLLAQLLGVLVTPEYGLVGTLQANIQKLFFILKAKGGE
ncbi:MAG: 50S ribosomal protein L10 [Candidatus Microgenomates bacterium]|jgi:large subunit ribosomal protein L10